MIYCIVFFTAILFAFIANSTTSNKKSSLHVVLISLIPILFASLRYQIGIDYQNYEIRITEYVHTYSYTDVREICNLILCKAAYYLTGDIKGVFASYAIITWLVIMSFLYKYKDISLLPLTVIASLALLYAESYNIIRQAVAISIVIYSLRYIQEKKLLKFCIGILIAFGFHNTAIVALPLYLINFFENPKVNWKSFIVILVPILIPALVGGISNISLFSYYFSNYDAESTSVFQHIVLRVPIYLPLLIRRKRISAIQGMQLFYYCLLFEISYIVVASYYKWAFRLIYYFLIGQIMLCGAFVKSFKNPQYRMLSAIYFISYYILLFYVEYIKWGWSGIYPYKSFL